MSKNQRIKLYLILSLILFFAVYYLEQNLTLKHTNLEQITLKDMNKVIKTQGKIIEQNIIKNHSFIKIQNSKSQINAVFFNLNETIEKNKKYTIVGKVTPYQNKPQLTIIELY